MLRYDEYLTELWDKPAPLKWYRTPPDGIEASFKIGEDGYFVAFENHGDRFASGESIYNLVFGMEDDTVARKWGGGTNPYARNSYGILGTGKQFDVFSSVIAAIKEFISRTRPYQIFFSADEPSRKRLYTAFVKQVSSKISGYKGYETHDIDLKYHFGIDRDESCYVIEKT